MKYEPLNKQKHKHYSIRMNSPMEFCKNDTHCALILDEVERTASEAPIVFIMNEYNEFGLCMLQSLQTGKNTFLDASFKWTGNYIPALYRCYPFALLVEENSKQKILCFDTSSPVIVPNAEDGALALFTEDGNHSDHLDNVIHFLNAVETKKVSTKIAIKKIQDMKLLEEWQLKVKVKNKTEDIKGLWKVSKEKFSRITNDQFLDLKESGALSIIYGHFSSLFTLTRFADGRSTLSDNSGKTLVDRTKEKQAAATKKDVDSLVQNLLLDN